MRRLAYELFVTVFIAGVLLAQAAASLGLDLGINLSSRTRWPIIPYVMYDDPHYDGETIQAYYVLEGTLRDGTVVQLGREDLGLNLWNYLNVSNGLARDTTPNVSLLLRLYPKSDQLVEVRVKTLPFMITRSGQAAKAPVTVRTIPLNVAQ